MSKPEWCPADVWDTATIRMGIGGGYEMAGMIQTQREKIARAILAERARCGSIVSLYHDHPVESVAFVANEIADAILNPPAPAADGGGTAPIGAAATSGDGQ